MHVCVITLDFDPFKGGNHLPLFAALPTVTFTILANRAKTSGADLPSNVRILTLDESVGPYYYGFAHYRFARALLRRYPVHGAFWKAFDVLHLNQTVGPQLLHLQKTGVPLLYAVHHPVSADLAVAVQESSGFQNLRWKARYALLLRWQRMLCRNMPHVMTVSLTAARKIAADYAINASSIHIVPNGVDTGLLTPGDLTVADFDVIAVGSFVHPRKGFPYLAEAYRRLSSRGFRIADVGRRSSDQQAVLATIPHVRSFGTVHQDALISLLQRSSALLSTSLYEGFGLSLIEALSCGRPAFAFDGGAVHEVLDPIDASLVVPARDVPSLVGRIEAFLTLTPAERVKTGQAYRERVLDLYPMEKSAKALHDLYTSLLIKRTTPSPVRR